MTAPRRTIATVSLLLVAAVATPGLALAQENEPADCEYPLTVTDATGTEVTLEAAPESVVALQPSDAQTMWDVGARDQVVALPQTQYTSYLEDRGDRPNVKNEDGTVNEEVVTATEADLVLAANTTETEAVSQLRDAGLTVYHFDEADSIEDVYDHVTRTGRLTGNCEGANETVESMREDVAAVESAVEGRERPDVLYYFFEFTTGDGTHIHDLIETAGGSNVAAEAGITGYQSVNAEVVVSADPEWIVYPSDAQVPEGDPYDETTAVRENQTLSVNTHYVSQPAPRIVRPLVAMAEAFHPEAFADETETATGTETETDPATQTETPTATATDAPTDTETGTETTDGSAPGFGVVAAVAALALAVLAVGARGLTR